MHKPGIVITGASSGLGLELAKFMLQAGWHVMNLSLHSHGKIDAEYNYRMDWCKTDVGDYDSVVQAEEFTRNWVAGPIRALVNCAGINHIDYLENANPETWDIIMDSNAKSIFNTSKAFLEQLKVTKGVICNITSDAAWKPMTGSAAYNASKGAAHILTLQLARELTKKYDITVFGVAPGKLEGTGMSQYIDQRVMQMRGWTAEQALTYAQIGRLHPEEIPPKALADFLAFLLGSPARHRYFSGCIIPYGA